MLCDKNDKENKECLFSFNRMNKYYLFPFLVPLVCFSTKFFSEPIKMNNGNIVYAEDVPIEIRHTFTFLYQMINSTSLIFGGLLYFITIIRTKTENKSNIGKNLIKRNKDINLMLERSKPNKIKEFIIIIFMSILITLYNITKG